MHLETAALEPSSKSTAAAAAAATVVVDDVVVVVVVVVVFVWHHSQGCLPVPPLPSRGLSASSRSRSMAFDSKKHVRTNVDVYISLYMCIGYTNHYKAVP